ncbi:hypothetical protein Tco_0727696 [Tanacetum coccineum]|uniref:Uncharacterized protein n=1 Tax=Tanacetum coccineum TaxID=301880 RepID=A0ABQ4YLE3_9ASTR
MSLSLAENVIVARVDNRPPMLDKTQYSSWASRMLLYTRGKENGKLLVDLVLNGPFKYGTVTVLGTPTTPVTVRDRIYDELTDAEKIREGCDIKATNIVLQGLPQDIYNLERESKLYDELDMFTSPEWSKFVTDMKLVKDLHNTNFDHLYAYLRQHKAHANEVHLTRQRFFDPIALAYQPQDVHHSSVVHHQSYQAPPHQQPQASFPQLDSVLVVISFLPTNDPIASLNKEMDFISTTFIQGRQNQGYATNGARSNATTIGVNKTGGTNTIGQAKVIRCYNCQEEGHMEIPTLATFQTDDLDAFDSDCDEAPSASVVLMAKLSSYDSYILSKVIVDKNEKVADFENRIHSLKQQLNATVESHKTLSTTVDVLKMEYKAKEDKYLDEIIELEKQKKALDNMIYKMVQSMHMFDSDTEETLEMAEESRLKMHAKQNDPIMKEKKVNIALIDYVALNKLFEHFVKHFVS